MPLSSANRISDAGVPIAGDMMTPSPPSCSKRLDEVALLVDRIIVIGQDEGLPAAVEFRFDRLEDFGIERVHDVMHDHADDSRPGRSQRGRATVVDIAEFDGLFLDPVARHVGHQRTVAQGQRNGCRRKSERLRYRRKLDLLSQIPIPPHGANRSDSNN